MIICGPVYNPIVNLIEKYYLYKQLKQAIKNGDLKQTQEIVRKIERLGWDLPLLY